MRPKRICRTVKSMEAEAKSLEIKDNLSNPLKDKLEDQQQEKQQRAASGGAGAAAASFAEEAPNRDILGLLLSLSLVIPAFITENQCPVINLLYDINQLRNCDYLNRGAHSPNVYRLQSSS